MTTTTLPRALLEQALGERDRFQAELAARRAALAQQAEPAQEPVAWIYQNMYTEQEYLVWKKGTGGRNWRPLYTAPPQRKPLPKHDQHCVDVPGYGPMAVRLVRAVERAHGIGGNNG